ncbi:AMP-binding protein [Iamia sp. SCSIO 61187]|uniref:AMP-binding protein n=1 Tax=Iamia sp. SCSIO 61187 TaxID=2722752 RepID=UPI001C62FC5F|nr:AMP-binding protein [Iamia sp. SCSIO 61187]QYG92571.1 AMP-binding protein [Iamia sp. SCSIO 61187]
MLEGRNLWELVEARAEATPDAVMTIDESGQSVTFGAYKASAETVAAGLVAEGVGEGDVVSWVLPTWHGSLVLIAALCRIGAVQNPIIPIYRDREVGFVTRQAQSSMLIVPGEWRGFDYTAMAERIAEESPNPPKVLVTASTLPDGDPASLPPAPTPPATRADEPATWLFYTSGTTADPKGARHSDGDLIVTARGMCDRMLCREGDRNLMAFPVTHIAGPIWLASSLMYGLTNVITEAFDPKATPELAAKADVTLAGSATFFHMAYLAAQRAAPEGVRIFPSLRLCPGGGAPKPPALHKEIQDELGGLGIVSGWGLTEAPILTMGSALDPDDKLATTEGRPMPGVLLRTVSLDGVVTGPGEEGELRAKAPQMMRGYLDGSLDADAFDEDGWFRTGDLGVIDEDGYVRITGRVKDVIIRKGENVSAAEVENLLYEHPKVTDVAVIGIPDADRGEMVCAVVAGPEGGEPLTFDEMVAHLKAAGLRTQALPERLEVVDAIPRNASGKIPKHELRKTYSA